MYSGSASAQNVRIADYDVPVSRADRLDATALFITYGNDEWTQTRYMGRGNLESFYNSLPFAWRVMVDTRVEIEKTSHQPAQYREYAELDAEFHKYIRNEGLFFGGARVSGAWMYNYDHAVSRLDLSIGMGRYVDATALARALRIEEYLIKEHSLTDHLPKNIMLELAAVIDRRNEYKLRHGPTYWVEWLAEMDRVIISSGMVTGGAIGAVGHMRMREVIDRETVRPREHGWKVQWGVGYYFSEAMRSGGAKIWEYLSAELGYPLNLRSQVSVYGRASVPNYEDISDRFSLAGKLTFSYELSNRIDFLFTEGYTHQRNNDKTRRSGWYMERENQLSIDFFFYVENKISLGLSGALRHVNNNRRTYFGDLYRQAIYVSRDWQIYSTVKYHIL